MVSEVRKFVAVLLGRPNDWRLHRPVRPERPVLGVSIVGPIVLVVVTLVGWFAFADAVGEEDNVAFALFIGSVSIILMAWSNILSTRIRVLEPFFGGLDRMYRWHRWSGALSVAAMWLHIQDIDDVKGIAGASKDVADAAEELAGLGEKFLYVLVIVSFIRWVPYRWWKQSHKLLIVAFVTASWHFHTATKPYANDSLWGRWFQGIMLLGIAAWVYRVLWRDGIRRGRRYRVASIAPEGSSTAVELVPVGRPLKWRPGQFVFVRIGQGAVAEPHPFTISSISRDGYIRIIVKDLGDWSGAVDDRVRVGDSVRVEGPYGRLQLFPRQDTTVVWIAGGVGITPFLAGARVSRQGSAPHLFYAVRNREDTSGLKELIAAHEDGRIQLHLFASSEGDRLCEKDIASRFSQRGLTDAHVVMCGPDSLINDMTRVVRTLGVRHIHIEKFDIRTGIAPDLSREVDSLVSSVRQKSQGR